MRGRATTTWSASASIEIARSPLEVWEFVRRPDLAPLTSSNVARAYQVPGTPDGVGQRQVLVFRKPQRGVESTTLEVVRDVPGVLTEVHQVHDGLTWPWFESIYEMTPVGGGTVLALSMRQSLPRGQLPLVHPGRALARTCSSYVRTVKRLMESESEQMPI